MRKTACCACAGNAGNVYPTTDFKGKRKLAILARAMVHVGIAKPRWRGNRSRHSRRMGKPLSYVFGKRPMAMSVGEKSLQDIESGKVHMTTLYTSINGEFYCKEFNLDK